MNPTDRDKEPFRVGVLSVVKHDYHPRAIAAHPRFELRFVADEESRPDWTHERNALFAEEFGIPYLRAVKDALGTEKIDAVAVSPEAERHCELAIKAAERGLHVVVDKPLSTTIAACDSLVDAVRENGVQCLVWNRNYLPALIQAREAVRSGKVGRLKAIHCDFYFSKDAGPPLGTRKEGDPPIEWLERQLEAHADGSDGGVGASPMGELEVEGVYPLAYVDLLTEGAAVEKVFARTASHFHQAHADNEVDDLASVVMEIEGGIIGSLCIGRIGAESHPDIGEIKIRLVGTDGAAVISEARPEVSIHYKGQPDNDFRNRRIADRNNYLLAENFARAIDGEEEPVLGCLAARNICAVVTAALESAETGRSVEVDNRKK